MKKQIMFEGMSFNEGTPKSVMEILHATNEYGWRIRLWYGDDDGKSWNEENDIIGKVGLSTGTICPLLINNSRSLGGGIILSDCIVKIVDVVTKEVLYQHRTFNQSKFEAVGNSVVVDGKVWGKELTDLDQPKYANCKNFQQAYRLAAFMNGERMSK